MAEYSVLGARALDEIPVTEIMELVLSSKAPDPPLNQAEPVFPSVACLVGKGPSFDTANWDYILGETDCFGWVNESWQAGLRLGLPITAAFAQDNEALTIIKDVPDYTWIITQRSQHHRGDRPKFEFRAPWYQFEDRQGATTKLLGLCTGPNAVHVMASHGVKTIHFVGFDSCNWDESRMSDVSKPFYSEQIKSLGHEWTANTSIGSWRAYRMIAKEMKTAICETGIVPIWHDLQGLKAPVPEVRDLTDADMRAEILAHVNAAKSPLCFADISDALRLDLSRVMQICQTMLSDGSLKPGPSQI